MNKKIKSLVFLLIAVCVSVSNVKANEIAQKVIGCWKNTGKDTLCYQSDGAMYLNMGKFTMHGDWHVEEDILVIAFNVNTIKLEVISITADTFTYKSTKNSIVENDKKVPYQAPITERNKKSPTKTNKNGPAQDIAAIVTNTNGSGFSNVDGDLLINSPHCKNTPVFYSTISKKLVEQGIPNSESLVNDFFELICQATQNSALSEVISPAPFLTNYAFYSGAKKLGSWPCESGEKTTQKIVFQGIFITKNQVTRWQNTNKNEVNIWLANFYTAPSDAMKFTMQHVNDKWQLHSVCHSIRI
ncbi:hypothetical protein KO495_13655 [Colwellia sp. D2M02]|uniref:hypothetical protein n=1 Tax=Colwellia sp. D2M02 TaxID=2841562 RepID=UPI001C08B528|nr:hypothetical protein [Colwellia sp. D2M02]MBU2894355.1 hypothetical protein [Colwellia sp. D2M02]